MARDDEQDNRNSGFINIRWNNDEGRWQIGGKYTDNAGKKWDLGLVWTNSQSRDEAIALVGKQIGASLAGKGIEWKEREKKDNGGQRGPARR